MANGRLGQLNKLAASVPGANEKITKRLQETQATQLQSQLGAQPGPTGPKTAQALGAQAAGQQAQTQLQGAQQARQQAAQVGQMGLQESRLQAQQRLGEQQRGLSAKGRELANRLSDISNEAKTELLDKQLEFQEAEGGRKLMNQRQLADWAALNARNEEEFKNYAQAAQQAHERKLQYWNTVHKKLTQSLESGYVAGKKRLDAESQKELLRIKRSVEKRIAQYQNEAAVDMAKWQAIGTIGGAVAGGAFTAGSPAGIAVGAAAGGAAGSMAGGMIG